MNPKLLQQLLILAGGQLMLYFTLKWVFRSMDPHAERRDAALKQGSKILSRLKTKIELTEHEKLVLVDVVDPSDLTVTWDDIGGHDDIIRDLQESVVLPFTRPDIFRDDSVLFRAPSGLLLHGPPGCGKTMLAKALAKECGCCFINLQPSTFMDKWYGESQKLVEAVFTVARKLQPTLIFIDEIDAFLRERTSSDNESTAMVKAQFMSLWDGFSSDKSARVVIVGATNRWADVDRAILRRMPRTFLVNLPNMVQRADIFKHLLGHIEHDKVDTFRLAEMTDGCAGSDLKEICRLAAMALVRELVGRSEKVHDERLYDKRVRDERHPAATAAAAANGRSMRKLTQADLETAVRSFAQSRLQLQL